MAQPAQTQSAELNEAVLNIKLLALYSFIFLLLAWSASHQGLFPSS